jgi:hypothetical protein
MVSFLAKSSFVNYSKSFPLWHQNETAWNWLLNLVSSGTPRQLLSDTCGLSGAADKLRSTRFITDL